MNEERYFRDLLDDGLPEVEIAGLKYQQGAALQAIDPVAFRSGVSDCFSSLVSYGEVLEIGGGYYFLSELKAALEKKGILLIA